MYSTQEGGAYQFIVEEENKRALPVDSRFWTELYHNSTPWGLEVYEQDWQVEHKEEQIFMYK